MKISCELPNCLLNQNNEINDYDFILFHLFQNNKTYRKFFIENKKENRLTILDNSAYEFYISGQQLDENAFIKAIKLLNPTYFIVPDKLMDIKATIYNFLDWREKIDSSYKRLIVPQGKSFKEWLKCLDCMLNYDKDFDAIGISFHNDFFYDIGITSYCHQKFFWQTLFPENEDSFYAIGRVNVLYYLNMHGYLKTNKHIHLLGSHWPNEKKIYKKLNLHIDTWDTGFPVKAAIDGKSLKEIDSKPQIIIDNFIDSNLTDETKQLILNNIKTIKKW